MIGKATLNKILPKLVATLIFMNGFVNIVFAILPISFYDAIDLSETSHVFSYLAYQQASSILTVIVGIILISLAIGLYRKQRNSWVWSIIILIAFNIEHIYPTIKTIPLSLGIFSILILIIARRQFYIRGQAMQTQVIIAWLSVGFALFYGSIGCYLMRTQFNGLSTFVDAIYYTLVTYSTVGYGDIVPLTINAKLFTMTMILIGLGSFATVITVVVGPLLATRLKRVFNMVEHFNHLKHHAILCGVNQMTIQIAKDLQSENIESLFIDQNQERLTQMENLGFQIMSGDVLDKGVLKRSRLSEANCIVCAFNEDAQNILLTMMARDIVNQESIKHRAKIITVLEKPDNAKNAKKSGADELIIPVLLSSECLLKALQI